MSTGPSRWQLGPEAYPSWWNFVRQLIMFGAGVFTVLWVVVNPGHDVILLVTGLILIGLIPLENALVAMVKPKQTFEERVTRIVEDQQAKAGGTSEAGAGGDGPPAGGVRD